ncbi:MAG TPA: ABC transporter ATP-binding protein, partial [Methyloprofundus sp.]|nr:ABC transporter ATP-binding protein [Methyloprofundus sp.]
MIEVKNISKTFKLYSSPAHRLKEIVLRKSYHKNYQALDDVSFH